MPFRNRLVQAFCTLAPIGLAASVQAASQVPEQLVVEPFPRAEVVRKVVSENADHGVVIGAIRRINNQLRAEREARGTGELIRVTYAIPAGHDSQEAFVHAKQQLLARPHTMLFFCEGRECGSSSLWANQVLEFSRLYGPEDAQAYVSIRLDEEPQRFVSLYAITRGNRQVHLHVDQFSPEPAISEALYPTPATLVKVIHADGELIIPALDMQADESAETRAWLDLLNRTLRSDTRLRVRIDGAQALALVQNLREQGIRDQRLEIGDASPEEGVRIVKL